MLRLWTASLLLLVGCGSIEYGEDDRRETVITTGGYAYAAPAAAYPAPQGQVVYVQPEQPALPPPPQSPPPQSPPPQSPPPQSPPPQSPPPRYAPAPRYAAPVAPSIVQADDRRIYCSGNQRVRVGDVVLDGGDGPAIVASGNCVVELSESIVRGHPAVLAQGNAQLALRECRIQGDVVTHGNAQLETPGSRHERGRRLAN